MNYSHLIRFLFWRLSLLTYLTYLPDKQVILCSPYFISNSKGQFRISCDVTNLSHILLYPKNSLILQSPSPKPTQILFYPRHHSDIPNIQETKAIFWTNKSGFDTIYEWSLSQSDTLAQRNEKRDLHRWSLTLFRGGGGGGGQCDAPVTYLHICRMRVYAYIHVPIFFWQFLIFSVEKDATLFAPKNSPYCQENTKLVNFTPLS